MKILTILTCMMPKRTTIKKRTSKMEDPRMRSKKKRRRLEMMHWGSWIEEPQPWMQTKR